MRLFRLLLSIFLLWLAGCGSSPDADSKGGPKSATAPAPVAGKGRKLMLVGLDGADWAYLAPMIAAGELPELARLVAAGSSGPLLSQHPPLSPLLWTTIATGRPPLEHRILDFTRVSPQNHQLEPITSSERAVPALWNMVHAAGLKSVVIGLWATHPAEPVAGTMVSDRLLSSRAGKAPPGAVSPAAQERWAAQILADWEKRIDLAHMRRYLPGLRAEEMTGQVSQRDSYAQPVSALWRILVETHAAEQLAFEAQARDDAPFTFVYHQGSDSIGHVFAPYAPPRRPAISAADFQRYRDIPARYFRELDEVLGRYRAAAEARDAVLLLVSDHGFHWGSDRPEKLSSDESATAAKWHRMAGLYLLYDPRDAGVGPGAQVASAQMADGPSAGIDQVAGSVLALLGLPPSARLHQPPLPGVAEALASRESLAPYDYDVYCPRPLDPPSKGPSLDPEELEKLRALGYVGQAESGRFAKHFGTRSPGSFNNEGLLLNEAGRGAEAETAFRNALAMAPDYGSAALNLADLLAKRDPGGPQTREALLTALKAGSAEVVPRLLALAQRYRAENRREEELAFLNQAIAMAGKEPALRLARARCELERQACAEALADCEVAIALAPRDALAHGLYGLSQLCAGNEAAARLALDKALALDPDQPELKRLLKR